MKMDITGKWPRVGYDDINSSIILAWAATAEMDVILGTDTLLLLDIDDMPSWLTFQAKLRNLTEGVSEMAEIDEIAIYKSRSGKLHIQLTLYRPKPVVDRILLQFILGSDPIREQLSYERFVGNDQHPTLLVRPVGTEPEVSNWNEYWAYKPTFPEKA